MKVILTTSVAKMGIKGDIKNVSEGYARNFLFPRKLAIPASEYNVKQITSAVVSSKKSKSGKYAKVAKKLNGYRFEVKTKADEHSTLFAGYTAASLAKDLKDRGFEVSASVVQIDEPIKKLGFYEIPIDLGEEVKVGVTLVRE